MSTTKKHPWVLSAALLMFHLNCSSPTSSVPSEGRIKISIKGVSSTASALFKTSANIVTITSARVVIDEIEFESNIKDSVDFELEEPFVQDLMVDTTLHEITTVQIPFGIYEEMEIEIDKLSNKNGAVFAQYPELQNLSIRVEGYLNSDPTNTFVFTSDLSEEQEREFDPPLIIDEGTPSTNVVLTIDMGMWFVDRNNNHLDPRLENDRRVIESNIKASIKVFEDEDDDGEIDDDDDEEDDD
jgi:hypothetical protein